MSSWNYLHYSPEKWASPLYKSLRDLRKLTEAQAMERCGQLRREYAHLGMCTVTRNQIDNPFATDDARKVMLNEIAAYKKGTA